MPFRRGVTVPSPPHAHVWLYSFLGTVVGGRRGGVENKRAGGDSDFCSRGGERTFCSRRGEGYLKIAKRALKMHFLSEFLVNFKFV